MRVFSLSSLKKFWKQHPDSETNLRNWYKKIEEKEFKTLLEITQYFSFSDAVSNERVVFNIKGNNYRLIAAFNLDFQYCYIKFIGTHKEYDKIDAKTVEL